MSNKDFEAGKASSANVSLNGNGKNDNTNGVRSNKAPTNNLGNSSEPTTNGHFQANSTSQTNVNGNSNGNGLGYNNRKLTEKLPPVTVNPIQPRSRATDQLPGDFSLRPGATGGQVVLSGSLTAFSPSAILSLLNIQKQTGVLHLTNNIAGYIYIDRGEVWDAKLGAVVGAYALFQLFGWRQGHFAFEVNGMPTPKRTIEATLPVLQVRATLWLDNWNKYNQYIPSISHRIVISPDPRSVVIEPYQWAILTKIVARPLSIAELADELGQDLMTVTRIAADLVRVGVAIIKPPEDSSPNGRS